MSTNVYHLLPPPGAAADQREPLEEAVREVSARVRALNQEHRRLHARVDELRSGDPAVRRAHSRELPIDPQRPLTIFSIEEADAPAPLRKAGRG